MASCRLSRADWLASRRTPFLSGSFGARATLAKTRPRGVDALAAKEIGLHGQNVLDTLILAEEITSGSFYPLHSVTLRSRP
jgi:hypothetical protein